MKQILRLFGLFIGLFFLGHATALGQVQLSSTNVNVSVDACVSFPSAPYAISLIDLAETAAGDFELGTTQGFSLALPSGFYFTGTPAIALVAGADLDNISVAIGTNTATLEVSFNITDTNTQDTLRFTGLEIIAVTAGATGTLDYVQGSATGSSDNARLALFEVAAASSAVNLVGGTANGTDTVRAGSVYSVPLTVSGADEDSVLVSYQWYSGANSVSVNTLVSGAAGPSISINKDIQSSGTRYYQRQMTFSNGSIVCTVRSSSVAVTVVTLDPGSIGATATTICLEDPVNLTSTTGASTNNSEAISYYWQQAGNSGVWTNVTAGTYTSSTLNLGSGLVTQTTQYKRVAYSATTTPTTYETTPVTISVNRFPNATVGIAFANGSTSEAFICPGGDPITFLDTSSGYPTGTIITHQWQESRSDGSTFGPWTNITGENSAIYNPPAVTSSVKYRRQTTSTLNGVACTTKTTNELQITMGESVSLGSIKTTATHDGKVNDREEVVFKGGVASPIISDTDASATKGTVNYQWYTYTDSNPALSKINTATAKDYTPTQTLNVTTYYVRAATNTATNTITNNLDTCGIYNTPVILKAAVPTPGSFDTDIIGCANSSITLTEQVASTYPTYYAFQWQSSLSAGSGFTNVSGATERAYSTSTLTQTTYFRRIATLTVSGTLVYTPTTAIKVEINTLDPGTISYSGGALCYGADPAQITGGGSPTVGYSSLQWFSSTDGSNWNPIGGANTVNYDPPALTQTTYYKRALYKTVSSVACEAETASVTISIGSEIAGGSLANQTINSGGNPGTLTVSAGSSLSGLSYQWFSSADGGTTPVTIGTATASTYAPGTLTQTTSFQRVTYKTENGKQCEAATNWATITVNTVTAGSISGDTTICVGEGATIASASLGTGTTGGSTAYSWYAGTGPNSGSISWGTAIAGATASSYSPSNITSNTYYRRGYTNVLNGVSSTVFSNEVLITVTPLPVIDNTAIAATIINASCNAGSDGAIAALSSHISGGNTAVQQITEITVGGSPATADELSLIVNGTVFTHTVTSGQSTATIAGALINLVNADTALAVTASISSTANVIQLKADTAGTGFTAFASVGDSSTASMVTATTQANAAPNTYAWSKAGDPSFTATTLAISGLSAGTYTLAVTNGICTVNSTAFNISQPAVLGLTLATNCTETLTATPNGGVGPYTFVLTNPNGTTTTPISKPGAHQFGGLTIGATYSVQITDSSCAATVTKTLTIPTPMALDASLVTNTQVSCSNASDASINIPLTAISGGLAPYQYELSSGALTSTLTKNSASSANFTDLPAGLYNIIVTDASGCTATATRTIDSKSELKITSPPQAQPQRLSCKGDQTGSITIAITNDPSATPVVRWYKNNNGVPFATSGLTQSGLGAGNYRVEVSDGLAGQCKVTQTFIISEPEALEVNFEDAVNPTCYPNITGSVKVSVTGGTGPYYYSIDGGSLISFGTASNTGIDYTIQNISEGPHTINISDSNNCDSNIPLGHSLTIEAPEELIVTHDENTQVTPINCSTPGSLSVSVSGGTGPYFYQWTGPGNYNFTSNSSSLANGIFTAGNYSVKVTDKNQCSQTLNVNMPNTTNTFTVSGNVISEQCVTEESNSSRIELSTTAEAPYNVIWEKYGPSTQTTTSTTGSTTVSTTTTVFGWNNIPQANGRLTLTGLGFGEYRVSVTELNKPNSGCNTVVKAFTIAKSSLSISENILTPPSCENPVAKYTFRLQSTNALKYYLNGTEISPSSAVSSTFSLSSSTGKYTLSNLLEGSYTLRIVEQVSSGTTTTEGCELFANFTVTNYQPITYAGETNITLNLCDNEVSFPDTTLVSGGDPFVDPDGDPFYIYSWRGPNNFQYLGSNPITFNEGAYELEIKDANGCISAPILFNFTNNLAPIKITETIISPGCGVNSDGGSISVSLSGGKEPYNIEWYKQIPGTEDDPTPTYETINKTNQLSLSNLSAGTYRIEVASTLLSCDNQETITATRDFVLTPPLLNVTNQSVVHPSCENPEGSFSFSLNSASAVQFYLNEALVEVSSEDTSDFVYNAAEDLYTLKGLNNGNYTLKIVSIIAAESNQLGCEIFETFRLNYDAIAYNGSTNITLDICNNTDLYPNISDISGGDPFIDSNGDPYYIYSWKGPDNFQYLGTDPININEGIYELIIEDAKGCVTAPISFNFNNNILPISITETVTPLGCGTDNSDGAISINVSGGKAPYLIVWEREIPGTEENPDTTYELIGSNLLSVNNLTAGRYRLKITPSILNCNNAQALAFTKFYTFTPVETVQVLEGPFLNRALCLGEPGKLQLKVFDRNSATFSFYYNGELVTSTSLGNDSFELTIDNPVEEAILNVLNEFGCGISLPIITGVGEPDFSYTSTSLEQTGQISANEKVTFSNTSIEPYVRMEWDFGDGSPILTVTAENEATTDIVHTYSAAGSFIVSLRFYNVLGCYKETEQEVKIGKGYLVIFPSAFTPNRDGINDVFEPKYTGVKSFYLEIFDLWGNLIFSKQVDNLPVPSNWGWDGLYSTGKTYPHKSFRYRFTAMTHDDQQISYTGEATLLR